MIILQKELKSMSNFVENSIREETTAIEDFSDHLKELMILNHDTIEKIVLATGINNSRLYDYLNNLHIPSLQNAIKIADYYQCSLDFLFGFSDSYTKKHSITVEDTCTRVKKAIDGSGKSRYEISKLTNISQQHLHRWYHGKTVPAIESLIKLAKALDCSLDYLAGRE